MNNRLFWPLLLTVAALLRVWQITAALWYDEVFSAIMAGLPLTNLLTAAAGDVHPPTYYLLLALVATVAGTGEIAMRLPSLLAGLLLIPAVYRLALAVGAQTSTARAAAVVTALAPFQIHYSIEARSYAVLTLAVVLAAIGLAERRYWLAVVASLAALYLHNTAVLFLAPLWLISLRKERRYWLGGVLVALGYLPGLWWALDQAGHISGNYWIPKATNIPGRLGSMFDDMLFYAAGSPFVFASGVITSILLVLIITNGRWLITHGYHLPLAAVAGPALLLTAASIAWQPLMISRVMAPATPFYYTLLALVATRSPRRATALAGLAAPVLLATYAGIFSWHLGRAPVDHALAAELAQYDAIYHSSVGGAVVWAYYMPDTPQFLRPQRGVDLNQTLSSQTRAAIGLQEIDYNLIKCATIDGTASRRWAFVYFHNPVTTPGEIEFVAHVIQTQPNREIKVLREDNTVHAALHELTPECNHHEAINN